MKRLLLDTQVLLWWLADDPRLPAWAIAAVQAPGAEVFVSQVSLWELGIEPEHFLAVQHLPWIHRDLPLLTADRTLRGYGHQVIWMGDGGSGG